MSAEELVGFLESPRDDIVQVVLTNLLPFSSGNAHLALFSANKWHALDEVKKLSLSKRNPDIVRDAFIMLVNLSCNDEARSHLAKDKDSVCTYARMITSQSKFPFTQYLLMLWNNLAREKDVVDALDAPLLSGLFITANSHKCKTDSDYDFLYLSFAEFARTSPQAVAKLLPNLFDQLVNGDLNRRKAIAAAIKNCLFDEKLHDPLANDTPLIETIMIALKGPEDLDAEDTSNLPVVVQKCISKDKKREEDSEVQLLLVQCLILIGSSQSGRDSLRAKNAYFMVRELHLSSQDADVIEACEKYVNLVMRGEPQNVSNVDVTPEAEKKEEVEEVI